MAARKPAADPSSSADQQQQNAPDSGGGTATAVLDPPSTNEVVITEIADDDLPCSVARTPDGMSAMAGQSVLYWADASGRPKGADVTFWKDPGQDGHVRRSWEAEIRWKPDLESGGAGGHFQMTYPNPGGGDDYIVNGRQQLQPLVDQATRLGHQAVFGDAFIT